MKVIRQNMYVEAANSKKKKLLKWHHHPRLTDSDRKKKMNVQIPSLSTLVSLYQS